MRRGSHASRITLVLASSSGCVEAEADALADLFGGEGWELTRVTV